jgi:hypothetical protein
LVRSHLPISKAASRKRVAQPLWQQPAEVVVPRRAMLQRCKHAPRLPFRPLLPVLDLTQLASSCMLQQSSPVEIVASTSLAFLWMPHWCMLQRSPAPEWTLLRLTSPR